LRQLRKYMGVGELIKRDKANYRLKLSQLDDLPREVSKEVLKEVCRLLEVGDVSEVGGEVVLWLWRAVSSILTPALVVSIDRSFHCENVTRSP